jgi:hypothetical protein
MNALNPNFRWLERGEGEPVVLAHYVGAFLGALEIPEAVPSSAVTHTSCGCRIGATLRLQTATRRRCIWGPSP